jgi:ABC-type sugar transport system permease subunit
MKAAGRREDSSVLWAVQAKYAPYFFVAPFLILFCVFMVYPLVRSITMSLYTYAGPHTSRFIGLGHYRFFLTDLLLWIAVANTVIYAVAYMSLQIPLSLGLALLLNNARVRFRNWLRFAFFAPYLVGNVFVSMIFVLLLAQRQGWYFSWRRCRAWIENCTLRRRWMGRGRGRASGTSRCRASGQC